MEDKKNIIYCYSFLFEDGNSKNINIELDGETLSLINKEETALSWAELANKKCPNCTLNTTENKYCPIAKNLTQVIEMFKDSISSVNIEVKITSGMITTIEAHRLDRYANVGVSLKLRLPRGTQISDLNTSNGCIAVSGGSGTAQAHTSNGNISFDGFSGSVSVETSNGSISVSGSNLVYAASSNGSITGEIMSITPEGVTLRTSNGAINVEIDSGINADLEMSTSNGSVSVTGEGFSDVSIDDSDGSA